MFLFNIPINDYVLLALIGAALYFDLTRYRIPNYLTFPAIVWGLVSYSMVDGLSGLWFSFLGLIVGLAIFFIPFAMGGMGGGDVKLLGAVGALQGWQFVLAAGLMAAIAGGVIAIVYLIATGSLSRVLKKMAGVALAPFFSFLYYNTGREFFNRASVYFSSQESEKTVSGRLPYGIAIATGVMIFFALSSFPWGEVYINSLPWL